MAAAQSDVKEEEEVFSVYLFPVKFWFANLGDLFLVWVGTSARGSGGR